MQDEEDDDAPPLDEEDPAPFLPHREVCPLMNASNNAPVDSASTKETFRHLFVTATLQLAAMFFTDRREFRERVSLDATEHRSTCLQLHRLTCETLLRVMQARLGADIDVPAPIHPDDATAAPSKLWGPRKPCPLCGFTTFQTYLDSDGRHRRECMGHVIRETGGDRRQTVLCPLHWATDYDFLFFEPLDKPPTPHTKGVH